MTPEGYEEGYKDACTKEKRFLFWKWKEIVHDFKVNTPRKKDCLVEQVCSVCGYKTPLKHIHDFSYNSQRNVGTRRKCKRCGIEQLLYRFEKDDEGMVDEEWVDYVDL